MTQVTRVWGRAAVRVGASGAVVVAAGMVARSRGVPAIEREAFRRVNGLPQGAAGPLAVVMQAGSLPAVFVAAAAARRWGRPRLAGATALAGTAVWAGCKGLKRWTGRGRPADHLEDVRQRGAAARGLGFPSGHAAVAATLATVLAPEVPRSRRPALALTAATTAVARVYVGAHLPLDSVGGLALGVAAGTATRLTLGPRNRGRG